MPPGKLPPSAGSVGEENSVVAGGVELRNSRKQEWLIQPAQTAQTNRKAETRKAEEVKTQSAESIAQGVDV